MLLDEANLLSYVSRESKRSVKFEYENGLHIKKITVNNSKITLATYEFTYNSFANHTDIKKTELNKTILERYSMTEEGRLIYSCELQDEKSYALAFRTKEDYDVYSAALQGEYVNCVFSGNKDSVKVFSNNVLNVTAESNSFFSMAKLRSINYMTTLALQKTQVIIISLIIITMENFSAKNAA